ncbi:MAG: tyrosine-type recombinase/integrase [Candidatus Magasanikbacteria bacterium]|nr:tyrosine-type recombinase/integrase [Candidatus Magasanikbacteria bacterium]
MDPKPLSKLLIEFLEHLEIEKNRSQKTVQNYGFYLKRFLEWHGTNKKPSSIGLEDVRRYRLWLNRLIDVHGEILKKNTQNYHLIALRSFLKYLLKRDIETLAPEKIELIKMPDREVNFLEGHDLDRLLEAPLWNTKYRQQDNNKIPLSNPNLIAFRDKAILELLFSAGLRVSELVKLKKEHVNLKKDEFTITGKGRKSRVVFLSDEARDALKIYLNARKDLNPYLFVSYDKRAGTQKQHLNWNKIQGKKTKQKNAETEDKPLTQRSVQRIVEKYAKAAGITKQVTPHTLRHSYATDLLQNGADIRSVQTMLGHSSITTTQIYTHITDKELRNIHKKFHGKKRDEH